MVHSVFTLDDKVANLRRMHYAPETAGKCVHGLRYVYSRPNVFSLTTVFVFHS